MIDIAEIARIHTISFSAQRPWRLDEFSALTKQPNIFVHQEKEGFIMGRLVLDEAEIISIAVDPSYRRCGVGRGLLLAFKKTVCDAGARMLFLEVAGNNFAAIGLYETVGFRRIGLRKGYYPQNGHVAIDAINMCCDL